MSDNFTDEQRKLLSQVPEGGRFHRALIAKFEAQNDEAVVEVEDED